MANEFGWYRCPSCNAPTEAVDESGEQPPCSRCAPAAERDPSDPLPEFESEPDPESEPEAEPVPSTEPEAEPVPSTEPESEPETAVNFANPVVSLVST